MLTRARRRPIGLLSATLVALAMGACSSEPEVSRPGGSAGGPGTVLQCDEIEPGPAPLRLLTRVQYDNAVRDLLGDTTAPARSFPNENRVLGFENNAEVHAATPLLVEKYLTAAEDVAARAVSTRLSELLPCEPSPSDEAACAEGFVRTFGKRAFRRPLTDEEVTIFTDLFDASIEPYGFEDSIELVLQAMLQSPQFLYRVDTLGVSAASDGAVQLGPWEMASRLSFFVWNSVPDETLMAAADADELHTVEQIESQARRMLDDPRAREMVADFHRQWLNLDRFSGIFREGNGVPEADKWRQSVDMFLDRVFWDEGGDVRTLFTSPTVFVDAELAPLYGVSADGDGLVPVRAEDGERAGLLTQPGLMALLAHPDQSSPIQRGVFVRERILCDEIDAPPPDVDQTPPDPDPNATTRERFRLHTEAPACAECHAKIDGIGFGFENYDQLGRFRSDEFGLPIDASGDISHVDETSLAGEFEGAVELSAKLAESQQVRSCLVTQWYRYATGRVEGEADQCSMQQIRTKFGEADGNLKEMLVAIATSDVFRYRLEGSK